MQNTQSKGDEDGVRRKILCRLELCRKGFSEPFCFPVPDFQDDFQAEGSWKQFGAGLGPWRGSALSMNIVRQRTIIPGKVRQVFFAYGMNELGVKRVTAPLDKSDVERSIENLHLVVIS
jgi:hypothetical protein